MDPINKKNEKNLKVCCKQSNNLQHKKIFQILDTIFNLNQLTNITWNGIPSCKRSLLWKILLRYLPTTFQMHEEILTRKRSEYFLFVDKYYQLRKTNSYSEYYKQIKIDLPRTHPNLPIFQNKVTLKMFKRILYIWAVRHPASGYVQGMNDLISPFFFVYLNEYLNNNYDVPDISFIPQIVLGNVEADIFWTYARLLDDIQDNYTPDQPGIQKRIISLEKVISNVDNELYKHLQNNNIKFLQFGLRWMNNLLVRELPLPCIIRLWDTYFSEPSGFDQFHIFVCTALLVKFSKYLKSLNDFNELSIFLQNLPTFNWKESDINILLAEAYQYQSLYNNVLSRH